MADRPCKIRTTRMSAIYDTILAAQRENPAIKSLADIQDWFHQNYGNQITDQEIIDSMVATTPKKIDQAVKNLTTVRNNAKREAKIIDTLTELNTKMSGVKGEDISETQMQEVIDLTGELSKLVKAHPDLQNLDKYDLTTRLNDIQIMYTRFFGEKETLTSINKTVIANNMKLLRDGLKIKQLDTRLADIQEKIDNLKSEDIDVNNLVEPDVEVQHEAIDRAILEKEAELADAKAVYERRKADAVLKARASKTGLMGFKNPNAIKIKEGLLFAAREAWETPRTLKFMFDVSAFGVQAAPMVISSLTEVNWSSLVKGDFANAFTSQRQLANIFSETVLDIVESDLSAANEARKAGDPTAFKRAKGLKALELAKQIKTDPLYNLMLSSGLKIGESRSISNTEEYFHSTVLNKIKFAGLAKDISEDTMVSTLNTYRTLLFKEFYNSNPALPESEYKQAAKFINELTGTTDISLGAANFILSAPRLALSRLSLAFRRPFTVLGSIDLAESSFRNGIKFQTAADKFIAKEMVRMWKGYAKMFALVAAIAAIHPDVDWWPEFKKSFDPQESDFLRVRGKNTAYDFTGGLGAMYRMGAKTVILLTGPTGDASFLAKERDNFTRNATSGGDDLFGPAFTTLIKNRLHPTLTGGRSILTGKDFFGQVYHDMFGVGDVKSRTEALVRSVMPIYLETMLDQFAFTPNSKLTEDGFVSLVQGLGVNTFEYSNKSQSLISTDYFNQIKFKPDTDYPKEISAGKNSPTLDLQYLRTKYKEQYGNMVGEIIENDPDMSKSQFQSRVKAAAGRLKREFTSENQEQIKKLEKK